MLDTSQFGKGAIKTPKVIRDNHFRLAATPSLIDWSLPWIVPAILHQRDQKSSSSCTAQATGYYTETLNQTENNKEEYHSNRYVYSQVYVPEGGAYIWKAMAVPLKGQASAESVPDGDSTEVMMRDGSLNNQAKIEARADKYAVIPKSNIDQMAQVVLEYDGFVTGFNGHNGMFAPDGTVIDWSKTEWGHAVYVCGFELRNGKKYLKFKNSWSATWGTDGFGYFPEEFVNSGMMFDCYTYADIADLDPSSMPLTKKQVQRLQALEGFNDPAGCEYWEGKELDQYLVARIPDKISELTKSLNDQ